MDAIDRTIAMILRAFIILFLSCVVGLSAPPPLHRNSWTTNTAGAPVKGVDNLSVTNVGSGTNWQFFNVGPKTVARLGDITNSALGIQGTIPATNLALYTFQFTPIIDEEFIGLGGNLGVGRETWGVNQNGGGTVQNSGTITGDWEPGIVSMIVTNVADRAMIYNDNNNRSFSSITNMEIFCLMRVRVGLTNTATDQDAFFCGLTGGSVITEPTDGIFYRLTNNIWQVCTASASARTAITTLSNCVPMTWYTLAWWLDSTGTNVNFYMGMTPTNLVFQTNISATIPNTTAVGPGILSRKIVGATTRMTNWVDYYKMWVRRLL